APLDINQYDGPDVEGEFFYCESARRTGRFWLLVDPRSNRESSTDLLGERDEDALRAPEITEPIAVLVLHQLANEFGAVGAEPRSDIIDVFDGKHDATYAQRVRRGVVRLSAVSRRPPELRQLNTSMAVRGPHHGDVG